MRCIVMSPVFSTTMQLRQSLPAGISLIRYEFHQQFSIRYVPLRRILTMRGWCRRIGTPFPHRVLTRLGAPRLASAMSREMSGGVCAGDNAVR